MNTVESVIEDINEKGLLELIEKGKVDLEILKSRNLATIENLNYLFLVDRITITELSAYWKISRVTVYRKIVKEHGSKIVQARKVTGYDKTITLSPKVIFDNIYDYEDFLKWRSSNGKKTVSIAEAMEITKLPRKTILKLIRKDKLVARKRNSGKYEILRSSLLLYLFDYLINEKIRMEKAAEYLNLNGRTVIVKLHMSDLCL